MRVLAFGLALFVCSLFVQNAHLSAQTGLKVVGTGDGLEMLREIGAGFSKAHPDIALDIPPSIGSGGGIAAVGTGAERLGRVARPLTDSEVEYGLVYLPFAKIPSAVFTHPSTGVDGLTSEDLVKLYSGEITNWADLGGADLRVRLVRREDADSTLQVLKATMPGWDELTFSPRSKTALTTQEAIETARGVEGAIAFGPYSSPLENGLSVLEIDGHHPTDDSYPSAVTLALIYKDGTLEEDMQAFISFSQSDQARDLIRNFGGVPVGN
ncbi:PstS family phosphate ABC transporter substrate-binding protein [Labrenzia sp. VG12]|uniref:PstS family phosphate ABC transporter substrate-binding protein n=1 Tax=Labrenzia sp. VG12 TaxID=2021862 RepID=UPI000B8C28DA|nr:substrate-binding domain-containing protein [Labrenzia sp. VG12]ASP35347.1 phosphate ABC transporter substrate-binding protein [Labrenzia sp. VG12]